MKITYEVVCEMMDHRSLSHYFARELSPERLALLTPTERAERMLAQKRLSYQRKLAKPLLAYPVLSPRRHALPIETGWLSMTSSGTSLDRKDHPRLPLRLRAYALGACGGIFSRWGRYAPGVRTIS